MKRERDLSAAMTVAEKFFDSCNDTMSNLRDLKDNFLSQEPPGVDSSTVEEQQKELKVSCIQLQVFMCVPQLKMYIVLC